jgi:hypothetical protein
LPVRAVISAASRFMIGPSLSVVHAIRRSTMARHVFNWASVPTSSRAISRL